MARIAVCLVLVVGIAAGILFAIDPGLDIYISKLVFSPGGRVNNGIAAGILSAIREFHIKLFAVIIAVSAGALVLRMIYAKMPMLLPARAAWLDPADLSGRAGSRRQCGVQGKLGAAASRAGGRVRRHGEIQAMVGPERDLPEELLVRIG